MKFKLSNLMLFIKRIGKRINKKKKTNSLWL